MIVASDWTSKSVKIMQKLLPEDENIKEIVQENCDNLLPLLCHHHLHLVVVVVVVVVLVAAASPYLSSL